MIQRLLDHYPAPAFDHEVTLDQAFFKLCTDIEVANININVPPNIPSASSHPTPMVWPLTPVIE